jgi:hypothetical protein
MKIRHRVTDNRFFDYVLAQLFAFWQWLGEKLEIEIQLPEPTPQFIYSNVSPQVHVKDSEKGPQRPNRKKLTNREVKNIRDMWRTGVSQASIAEIYDVNRATISRIVRGQYHKGA